MTDFNTSAPSQRLDGAPKSDTAELNADIKIAFARLGHKIDQLEERLNARFDKLLADLTVRLGGLAVAAVGTVAVIEHLLH